MSDKLVVPIFFRTASLLVVLFFVVVIGGKSSKRISLGCSRGGRCSSPLFVKFFSSTLGGGAESVIVDIRLDVFDCDAGAGVGCRCRCF